MIFKEKQLILNLQKKKLSLAVAESCTGGYLSYLLTRTPGSSKVFKGGLIVYSLGAKHKLLKIPLSKLEKDHGVSAEISLLLAKNVRITLNADIGASITGFAGPGARKGIKAGTVFFGISDKKGSQVKKIIFTGDRDTIRKKAGKYLIDLLHRRLNG